MERKIKFRGKNRYRKEWLYGNLSQYRDGSYGIDGVPVETDSVGQFVGVTDEHGKEVFEGDVLEADYKYDRLGYNGGVDPDNDCICYGVVEFDNDALQWVLNIYKAEYPISKQIEEDGCSLSPLQIFGHEYGYDNCNLKIIGNRFDNPSLISDKR
jgi:uncharacterized phage protein (TIGR01671 family)